MFDTYRDQILKRFVKINEKKIENLQKEMQLQTQKIQTQQQIKKQIEKKQEQLLKLKVKLKEQQSKRDQNKLIEYKQQKQQLIEIKNLLKMNETVFKMNKIEENILFYMLPDTVIYKYFDERNLGKPKDRKRKSSQLVQSTQQQRSSSKKGKPLKGSQSTKGNNKNDMQLQQPNEKVKVLSQSSTGSKLIQHQKNGFY